MGVALCKRSAFVIAVLMHSDLFKKTRDLFLFCQYHTCSLKVTIIGASDSGYMI